MVWLRSGRNRAGRAGVLFGEVHWASFCVPFRDIPPKTAGRSGSGFWRELRDSAARVVRPDACAPGVTAGGQCAGRAVPWRPALTACARRRVGRTLAPARCQNARRRDRRAFVRAAGVGPGIGGMGRDGFSDTMSRGGVAPADGGPIGSLPFDAERVEPVRRGADRGSPAGVRGPERPRTIASHGAASRSGCAWS